VEYRWSDTKTNFISKFYLYLPKENKERKLCQRVRDASLGLLSAGLLVMEFRFGAMLRCNLGDEGLMLVKSSRGP